MHRETVEATNGKPDSQLSYSMVVMDTYGKVSVYYRGNIVAAILVDPSPEVQTNKGLRMPASRKEVIRIYGEPAFNDQDGLTYNFEAVGDRLQAMSLFKQLDNKYFNNIKFQLTFITNDTNPDQMESYILSDLDFIYEEYFGPKPLS
ncbi:hypothetical protein [Paenibacillus sp. sgz500958]|uniref:hypothetical protein n=1 Tax=Paenibacillus sp. sgz500958 TaxID=3242475 RepID=UPI0036D399CF